MPKLLQLIICVCFLQTAQSQTAVCGVYQFAFSNNSTLDLRIIQKIDELINMYDIPEQKRDKAWNEKHNSLTHALAEL